MWDGLPDSTNSCWGGKNRELPGRFIWLQTNNLEPIEDARNLRACPQQATPPHRLSFFVVVLVAIGSLAHAT
jgi:hypothetical protein